MSTVSKVETAQPTVLVVDDEAGPRSALTVILRPFFKIQAAANAQAALDVLHTQSVDLVTLDQKLPDRAGMDLLQEIKQAYAETEVVIITGYGSLHSALEGIRYGAAGYLLKPFNVTELITLMTQTLAKKKRLDFIRNFFNSAPALGGAEHDSAQAWHTLKTGYDGLGAHANGEAGHPAEQGDVLPLLSDMLEAKDRQLLNHASRVSFYATLLGHRLTLPSDLQQALTMGAFLHDIGKTTLPASSRFPADPGAVLGDDEPFEDHPAKDHPDRGARLIRPLGLPAEVGQIVSSHHERWDGRGYPDGLHGEGIPRLARIVSIAQRFDHLTAEVPGRSSLTIDDALRAISLESNTRFDPQFTRLFIEVVSECKPTSFDGNRRGCGQLHHAASPPTHVIR